MNIVFARLNIIVIYQNINGDKVCQRLWYFTGTSVSSINKADRHDITDILLKMALNTINQTYPKH